MSGRRRGGRFQRGKFKGIKNGYKKKTKLEDHIYYLGSATQASDYETTTSFIINHIMKTYTRGRDIAEASETLEELDFTTSKPTLKKSIETDADLKKTEEKQFEYEFKDDYAEYRKRILTYNDNKVKAYALLWERCSKGMKNKLESRKDFDTFNKNPLLLLQAIKEHALNYQENKYEMSIISQALRCLLNCKQKEKESLQDYTKRFRVAAEVLESHMGCPIYLLKLMANMKEFNKDDSDSVTKCGKQKHEQFLAYVYLENADQAKYGSILSGLNTQNSLRNE